MLYTKPHKVLKFGGTSLGRPDNFKNAVAIMKRAADEGRVVVIASALSGVTDLLVSVGEKKTGHKTLHSVEVRALEERHLSHASDLLKTRSLQVYSRRLSEVLTEHNKNEPGRHDVLALGERLSVPLLALALRDTGLKAVPVDARSLVRVNVADGEVFVRLPTTIRLIRSWYDGVPDDVVPVVTGYVAGDDAGRTVTLGRGGSDYSAALFSAALEAGVFERWTDVDGIYTDDPRRNGDAEQIPVIALEEALEETRAGNLGLHKRALDPLLSAGIPIHIRSTLHPERPGTWITPSHPHELDRLSVASA